MRCSKGEGGELCTERAYCTGVQSTSAGPGTLMDAGTLFIAIWTVPSWAASHVTICYLLFLSLLSLLCRITRMAWNLKQDRQLLL